jgi:hypothetical protein
VSHNQERVEKNCLNCNAEVVGRFCQICGQENIEPKESFWVLATHFIHDLTHFDGKFFGTLKYLLFKPAFLSKEYLRGRRTSYLHPIRMYVFTSAFFFLIFFNFFNSEETLKINEERRPVASEIKRLKDQKYILETAISKVDSSDLDMSLEKTKSKVEKLNQEISALQKDSTKRDSIIAANNSFTILGERDDDSPNASSINQYDSIQNLLPIAKRDGVFRRRIKHQEIHLKEKYKNNVFAMGKAVLEKFMHMFPQLLFVSLPFFALILQLLYVRRKQLFYVNHVVFTIHLYCGTFIIILASLLVGSILSVFHLDMTLYGIISYFINLFFWYKSFRNFYGQSMGKTILKFVLLFFMTLVLMLILFVFFFVFSAFLI